MAQKLFVCGIAFNTTEEALNTFFSQAGEVASAAIVTDRDTGRSRGFGFVEMTSAEGAQRAVADLNGRDLDGRSLKVEIAKPKAAAGYASQPGRGSWR
jgi:RNA recognition motif-containing protein